MSKRNNFFEDFQERAKKRKLNLVEKIGIDLVQQAKEEFQKVSQKEIINVVINRKINPKEALQVILARMSSGAFYASEKELEYVVKLTSCSREDAHTTLLVREEIMKLKKLGYKNHEAIVELTTRMTLKESISQLQNLNLEVPTISEICPKRKYEETEPNDESCPNFKKRKKEYEEENSVAEEPEIDSYEPSTPHVHFGYDLQETFSEVEESCSEELQVEQGEEVEEASHPENLNDPFSESEVSETELPTLNKKRFPQFPMEPFPFKKLMK